MKKRILLGLVIALVAFGFMMSLPKNATPAAGAGLQSATLYINPQSTPNAAAGATVTLQLKVFQMPGFNAWDLKVKSDPTILNPTDFSSTGNVLEANDSFPPLFVLTHCVNGMGTGCDLAGGDGPGVIHSAAFGLGSAPTTPQTGLILTITYKAASATGFSSIHIFNDALSANGVNVNHSELDGTYGSAPVTGVLTLSATPPQVMTPVGTPGTTLIGATGTNGLTGAVTLTQSVQGSPTGFTCTPLSPATITLGTATTSTLSCTGTMAGTFNVVVKGTVGTTSSSVTVPFIVTPITPPKDFTVTANPMTVPVTAGGSGTSTITVTAMNGLTGTVTLAPPIVSPTNGLTCQLSQTSITLGTTPGTSTLTCNAANIASGSFTVTVSGSNGALVRNVMVTFMVSPVQQQGFSLTPSQTTVACNVGQSKTVTISVTSSGGFTGTVTLNVMAIPTSTVTPTLSTSSVTGGTGTSTLTLECNAAGTATVTVTGTSGSLTPSSTIVTVTVSSPVVPSFTLTASPTIVTCTTGGTAQSMITVTSQNVFTGNVALTVQSSAAGVATGTLSSSTVTGGAGSVTLNINCVAAGSTTLTVTGSSGILTPASATVMVSVNQPVTGSFNLNAAPTSLTCHANGGTIQSTIMVTGLNGFNGLVLLTSTIMPDNGGIGASLTHGTVTGSGESILNLQCFREGTYTINVEGMSGGVTKHAPLITVTVTPVQVTADFAITANPSMVAVKQGGHAESTITVASVNSFSGTVDLSSSVSCANVHTTVAMSHVQVAAGSSGSAKLMINADANASRGTCTVTVTGVSGSLSHSATVKVTVVAKPGHECVGADDDHDTDDHGHHDKMMGRDRDDGNCVRKCHRDNESVEGSEHENPRAEKCPGAPTHGVDHDDDPTSMAIRHEWI